MVTLMHFQLQVSKYMQSKVRKENNTFQLIVGDMAHVLKSSVTVDSARMKTLIPFCIMEYTSWQFLAHCHPNTGIRNPYLYVTDDGDEVIIMCGKRLFYEVFFF
ncbi:uncharacterized protein LOC105845244 isoform X1 [Hydra vulgaris]|uniref:uncharacterized protein LOC105845244 isoform X1 n=1 Tax=Hydra vulgaris TaxID=6087 RepID=UPI001F5ED632|nr:uncharacterized protein LOC105845244 isoform X1 [Hydra vulgaris]